MKDYKSVVAQRIKTARRAAGFKTQAALADALDIDQSRVARWEIGQNLPSGGYRTKFLQAVHKSEDEIFGHADPQETAPDILEAIERGVAKTLAKAAPALSPDKQRLVGLIGLLDDKSVLDILRTVERLVPNESKNRARSSR